MMLSESHPLIRRALRFIALPYCYVKLINWNECTASKMQVLKDLLYIFFKLKYFPDNYSPCRLWEKDRRQWSFYYGSSYHPYQRHRLRKKVQRFELQVLFDNKEVCELLVRGMDVYLPKYFGAISPNMDYKKKIEEIINSMEKDQIIIKPVAGQAGRGIVVAFHNGNTTKVKVENTELDLADYQLGERSIIQEVVVQHEKIARIARASVNTIRVLTFYTQSNNAVVISASMRFGVGQSYVDNWCAGGIAVGVDYVNGCLKKIAYDKNGKQYTEHPISKISFEGFEIPKWKEVLQMAKTVQKACPFFKLLGMDIALAEDSRPILIEINPNPDIIFQEQTAGPLFRDRNTYDRFKEYDLFVNRYQESLY